MIYILDHCYAADHEEYCLILESDRTTREVVELTAALAFLLEDIIFEPVSLDVECLKKLLTSYFDFADIKEELPGNLFERILLPIDSIFKETAIPVGSNILKLAVIIDLYAGRDCYSRCNRKKLYAKYFPAGEQMEEIREILLGEGVEE